MDEALVRGLIRSDFPFLKKCHYLDSASVCPPPRPVVEAMSSFYSDHPLNYGVGEFRAAREVKEKVDRAREAIAGFVGASAGEIVFTKNTTEAINLVSRGLSFKRGEALVLTTLEHQSNIIPWLRAAREQDLAVHYLQPQRDGRVSPASLERLLDEHPVRMVAATHVSNVLGTVQDVAALIQAARRRGALTLVDAAQSAGRVPVNVGELGCDFAAFCGRKALMGPQGTGFLFIRRDRLEELAPLYTGSRAGELESAQHYRDQPPPHRFEAGVLNTSGVIGLGESVAYLARLGSHRVAERVRSLSRLLVEVLAARKGVVLHSPADGAALAGIVSWHIPAVAPRLVSEWLDREANVAVAAGHQGSRLVTEPLSPEGIVRTSVHWFNLQEDLQALGEGLDRFLAGPDGRQPFSPGLRNKP